MSDSSVIISLGGQLLGSTGMVAERTEGDVARRRRVEMGLIPDRAVTAVRSAPLDDPVEYFVLDRLVTLRRLDAQHALVEVTP